MYGQADLIRWHPEFQNFLNLTVISFPLIMFISETSPLR